MADPVYRYPTFEVGVSLNGHVEEFLLSSAFYNQVAQEEGVDPFNFTEIWIYIAKHIEEYLFEFDITEAAGPVDVDNLRLISLVININVAPTQLREVLTCNDCFEKYNEELQQRVRGKSHDNEDED